MPSPLVPKLPVLVGGEIDHPEWRAYVKWVYGDDVAQGERLDLNTFTWFYWGSPLDDVVDPEAVSTLSPPWSRAAFPENYAWVSEVPIVPETNFSPFGFFVSRLEYPSTVGALTSTGRLEVLRVKFPEKGAAWFYYTRGSGVFLNLDSLPVQGDVLVSFGDPPNHGLLDGGVVQYMSERNCSLLAIVQRFADRRVEIVVRSPGAEDSLDETCLFGTRAFSTGLSKRAPCDCTGSRTVLLNCRRQVYDKFPSPFVGWIRNAYTDIVIAARVASVALMLCAAVLQLLGR